MCQDFVGRQPLLGKFHRAPLRQPLTGDGRAAAILRKEWLHRALADQIIIEDFVHNLRDIIKNIAPLDKILVIGRWVRDIIIIALRTVPFRINPVERKGNLCVNVCPDSVFRPGRVDFWRSHILDIIREGDRDILRVRAGRAEMHGDGFRNKRQRHSVSLLFCLLRDGRRRDDLDYLLGLCVLRARHQEYRQGGHHPVKHRHVHNAHRLVRGVLHLYRVPRVRDLPAGMHRRRTRRRRKVKNRRKPWAVGQRAEKQRRRYALLLPGLADRDQRARNGKGIPRGRRLDNQLAHACHIGFCQGNPSFIWVLRRIFWTSGPAG